MNRVSLVGLASALLMGLAGSGVASAAPANVVPAAVPASGANTYTLLVGDEVVSRGVDIEAYFPNTLHIHVGDTVLWKQNTNEIHTVTFLAGAQPPPLIVPAPAGLPSPLMLNPQAAFPVRPVNGLYNGSSFASSGLMSLEPGPAASSFSLTFTAKGTFTYMCLVHGVEMSGTIVVEDANVRVPSPAQVMAQAQQLIAQKLAQVPAAMLEAQSMIKRPTRNPDGTSTYYVNVGFMKGQIDLMHFFPNRLTVHPGDTVQWTLSMADGAPHTVTFLNGAASPSDFLVVPQPSGPPLLLANPAVFFPQNVGKPLTRNGIYNSGLLDPVMGPTSYSLKIGNITGLEPYECLLHDASGMQGWLYVAQGVPAMATNSMIH